MSVNLDRSRLLRVVAFAFVVDTAHEGVIDAHDFPRSGQLASRALSACHPLSYTACTALREHLDKLLPNDLKLRADDSKLQIGDSWLRIVDFTLPPERVNDLRQFSFALRVRLPASWPPDTPALVG